MTGDEWGWLARADDEWLTARQARLAAELAARWAEQARRARL